MRKLMRHHLRHITNIILAVILLTQNINAQKLDQTTSHIAQSLLRAGVDTVLIYNPYDCPTSYRPTDTSILVDISYIITKKGDLLNIERLTYEYLQGHGLILTHNSIFKKDSPGIFNYLNSNFNSIVSDTLLPGMLKYRIDGKDTLIRHLGSHPCHTELIIKTASGTFMNGMIDKDLADGITRNEDGSFRSRQESVNYEYNISTSIYKIISMLQIEEEELRKKFEF